MDGKERILKTWSFYKEFTFYFLEDFDESLFFRGLFLFEGYTVTVVMLFAKFEELSHALKSLVQAIADLWTTNDGAAASFKDAGPTILL